MGQEEVLLVPNQVPVVYQGDVDSMTGMPGAPVYDVRVVRKRDKGRLRIASVPPEELDW